MPDAPERTRLFLVAPQAPDLTAFPPQLSKALAGGDVAAVLIPADESLAAALVPVAQAAGAAALIADDTRLAGRVKADGVHIGSGLSALRAAVESFRPKRIVGAGNLNARHRAMEAGEAGADYVFFGRPYGDTHDEPHPKALDLAEWWSELMEVPAVVMAGRSLKSVATAASTGAAFVALHDAVWSFERGPGEAVRLALASIEEAERRAA